MPNEIDPLHTSSGAQAFSDYRLPEEVLFRQRAIGLEHECHGLTQMRARLLECCTLRVRARQLFHEGDIPFAVWGTSHCVAPSACNIHEV